MMKCIKAHALGNDFVIILDEQFKVLSKEFILKICDRKQGIGCDQLIYSYPYQDGYKVLFWNQDGSEASFCGNGMRCLAKCYLPNNGEITNMHNNQIGNFYTPIGLVNTILIESDAESTNNLQSSAKCNWVSFSLPVTPQIQAFDYKLQAYDVYVGNDHIVIFGDNEPNWNHVTNDLSDYLTTRNIMWIWGEGNTWNIRSWERGAGETLACGSGAIASAVAIWKKYNVKNMSDSKDSINFHTKIGRLSVTKRDKIWQSGPAEIVANVEILHHTLL